MLQSEGLPRRLWIFPVTANVDVCLTLGPNPEFQMERWMSFGRINEDHVLAELGQTEADGEMKLTPRGDGGSPLVKSKYGSIGFLESSSSSAKQNETKGTE